MSVSVLLMMVYTRYDQRSPQKIIIIAMAIMMDTTIAMTQCLHPEAPWVGVYGMVMVVSVVGGPSGELGRRRAELGVDDCGVELERGSAGSDVCTEEISSMDAFGA